ncbi:MAG: hypothetical protein KAS32_11225 [Candidatus Peribacteraceae bacterium]|nr:hypothetical protein [Candidatus Peribacteraceae bacterium]
MNQDNNPFIIILEKYREPVLINSITIDPDDECLLNIDFDSDIDAPLEEVKKELERVIISRISCAVDVVRDPADDIE